MADTTQARKGLNDPKDSDFDAAGTSPQAGPSKQNPTKSAPEHAGELDKADPKEKAAKDAHKAESGKLTEAEGSAAMKAQAIGQLKPPTYTDAKLFEAPTPPWP